MGRWYRLVWEKKKPGGSVPPWVLLQFLPPGSTLESLP